MEKSNPSECLITHLKRDFNSYRELLAKTAILNEDYLSMIEKYDSKDTFFYLDPPFHDMECQFVACDVDPTQIADALKGLKGKFLLSYNDYPEFLMKKLIPF